MYFGQWAQVGAGSEGTMRNESLIVVIGIVVLGVLLVYSGFQGFFNIPDKNAEIEYYQNSASVWHDRAEELETVVTDYRDALKFETVFMMFAKATDITACAEAEKRMRDNMEFCTEDCRK